MRLSSMGFRKELYLLFLLKSLRRTVTFFSLYFLNSFEPRQDSQCKIAVRGRLAEPYKHALSILIDGSHNVNLLITLFYICLVDADGINPKKAALFLKTQLPQCSFAVWRHKQDLSMALNRLLVTKETPCV
jgi:hypothetical protein